MKPRLDALDVMVALGMFATIIGGIVIVIASYGVLGAGFPAQKYLEPMTVSSAMNSLQVALDETRAEADRLEQQFMTTMSQMDNTVAALNRKIEHAGKQPALAQTVQSRFEKAKNQHDGQVQYLTGKTIVTLTGQGMRTGALSANNLYGPANDRIIKTASKYAALGRGAFNGQSQAMLGKWIVAESQSRQRLHTQLQEGIGRAIVQKASMEHAYLTDKAQVKNQLFALAAAAVRTETTQTLVAQLQQAEQGFHGSAGIALPAEPIRASGYSMWRELPVGLPLVLMILLPAILMWALTFPRVSLEKTININRILELAGELSGPRQIKRV